MASVSSVRPGREVATPRGIRALRGGFILALHLPPATLLLTGLGPSHAIAFACFYPLVLFVLGAGLHRYFAHRSFATSRPFQLALAAACAAFFADPVAFAGHHRLHHRHSDTERDFHGPRRGLWFGWIGHLLSDPYPEEELLAATPDLTRFPELVWLHRYGFLAGALAVALTLAVGGWAWFAAGYCLAWCLVAIHGASAVNYLGHRGGRQRYDTGDRSTNNPWLGVLLFGEGWHNNHHRFPRAARAGHFWWELDVLYWMLRALAALGLVWGLREVPAARRA
jgi:stearoyl-CoA desaturase (delta-9 desaturase)